MAEYVIPWIASTLSVSTLAATTIFYAALVAASVAIQDDQRRSAHHKADDAYNRSQKDRYLMVRGALEPRRLVLGRRRTSGQLLYVGSYGTDKENLVFCVALAGHEVDAIEEIYFDDEPVILDVDGNVIGIKRTEEFSISTASATFTLASDMEGGSVTATAYYGSDEVTLTVSVSGRDVTVSGARAGEVGRLAIQYRPSPNPYKPTTLYSAYSNFLGTGSPQTVTLAHVPVAASVKVFTIVGAGEDTLESEVEFTLSGANVTFTAPSGVGGRIEYQWATNSASLARVRRYLGRMDQAADPGMMAALPGVWTSAHRAAGVAYLVVELNYDREAFPGGLPNVSAIVRGLKAFDPRKAKVPSPAMDGAMPGTPGTLPTGWATSVSDGLVREVVSVGTDPKTGWPAITFRVSGTATGAGSIYVSPVPYAAGPAAAPGQTWSARMMVRRVAGDAWSAWTQPRLQLLSYSSTGAVTVEAFAAIAAAHADAVADWVSVTDTAMGASTTRAGVRLRLGYGAGQVVDSTFMVILPQLWQGAVGAAGDPVAWTENLVLQAYAYAAHPLGGRTAWQHMDLAWLATEANVCDTATTYTVGGKNYVRPLYRGGYVALSSQRPTDVLNDLCAAMGGDWADINGQLRIRAGAWRAPVLTLDESWLQGDQPVQIQAAVERDQLVNSITGSFPDERQGYRMVSFTPVRPDTYISADGDELPLEVEYGAASFEGQVQYVSACAARRARQGMVVQVHCNLRAWQAQKFDNLYVNLARFGFVGKTFEVVEDGFDVDGGITLLLRETHPSTWDMDAGFPGIDPAPNTRLPDPWAIATIQGLAAASGNAWLLLQTDGSVVSRVAVSWDPVTDPRVTESTGSIEIDWQQLGDTAWQTIKVPGTATRAFISPAPDGRYVIIKGRAIGAVGRSPDCLQIIHQVQGKTSLPSNVAGELAIVEYGGIALQWLACPNADYAETEIRRDGTDWDSAVPLDGDGSQPTLVRGNRYKWEWPAYGTYAVRFKHRDASGNESPTATSLWVTVDDRIKLGSSGIDVDLAGINLVPNSSFERDSDGNGLADGLASATAGTTGTNTNSRVAGRISGQAQRRSCTSLGGTVNDRTGYYCDIPVGAGAVQAAVASVWYQASANVTMRLSVNAYDAGSALVASAAQTATASPTEWQRVQVSLADVPPTAVKLRVYTWVQAATDANPVWMVVDDLQLEEGTAASAWHPYPGDVVPKVWIQDADPGSAAIDGDEWFDTNDSNKHYARVGGVWVSVRDAGITQALLDAANAQDTADGKIKSYYQTTPPPGASASLGDLWFDTDDANTPYRWSGSAWVLAKDNDIAQALADAADAQSTADGKVTTYFQATAPTAEAVGDLWFKTTDARMYRWSGSAWVLQSTVGSGDIDTDELAPDAATDGPFTSTEALLSFTAPAGGGGVSVLACETTYANGTGEAVSVEVQASWNCTVVGAGTGSSDCDAYINCVVLNAANVFQYTVGELHPEAPVPPVGSGQTVRWTAARTVTAELPAGYKVRATIVNQLSNLGNNGGTTITLRDGVLRMTVIKR